MSRVVSNAESVGVEPYAILQSIALLNNVAECYCVRMVNK